VNLPRINLDNAQAGPHAPAERILFRLKSHGAQATAVLAGALGLSAEAVRQQLAKLAEAGLIEGCAEQRAPGAGRPRQLWTLTTAGHARFPDTHAQLAAELIGSVRALFGEDGLQRLIGAREAASRAAYRQAMQGARGLGERVRRLAALRQGEGYMARAERAGRGWRLVEDHCPICAAARACEGFCRSELALFGEILDAPVVREEHLLGGARRCVYRIGRD